MPNPKLETYKHKATGTIYDYTDADAQTKLTGILDGTTIDSFGDVETALSGKASLDEHGQVPTSELFDVSGNLSWDEDFTTRKTVLVSRFTNSVINNDNFAVSSGAVYRGISDIWSSNARTGVHNLNGTKYDASQESYGITGDLNADKSVTLSGTNTGTLTIIGGTGTRAFTAEFDADVILSGGISNNIYLELYDRNTSLDIATSKGSEATAHITKGHSYNLNIKVAVNYAIGDTPVTVYPLIRFASDTDSTYAPPAMTNGELTEKVQGIIDAANNAADFAAFKTAIGNL